MRVFLNQLKEGMVVAQDIHNHGGRKLLPKGTVLTERHVRNLKAWGITEVVTQEENEENATNMSRQIDPQQMAKAKKEANKLFVQSNQDHPAIEELMRLCTLDILKRKMGLSHIHVK